MSRPIEVLHVIESLRHGGAEQNLISMLRRLPCERFTNHLAYLDHAGTLEGEFRSLCASLVPLDADRPGGLIRATAMLSRWLVGHRVDVIHVQLLRAQLVARAAALMALHIPVVTTWQNAFYDERAASDFGSPWRRHLVRWLDQTSGRFDHHFIAVSQHVAEQCAGQLGIAPARVSVIFNAVEPERFAPVSSALLAQTRSALGLAPDAKVLLTVGRLVVQKAQHTLLAAMPSVLAEHPQAVLLIAGTGPLHAELESARQALALGDRVRLLGRRSDIPVLCQLADLFVFPSLYEGLSVALVEALANGLPAVVSDIPQNREAAYGLHNVRLVPRHSPTAFAQAINDMLATAPAQRASSPVELARLRARFSPDLLARQLGEVLRAAAHHAWAPATAPR